MHPAAQHLASWLARAIKPLTEACYPATCSSCSAFLEAAGMICDSCQQKLLALEQIAACPRCARPIAAPAAPCPWCVGKGLYPYVRIANLATYEEPLRGLIHRMKYQGQWHLGEELAERLYQRPLLKGILSDAQLIVAVPLHFRRQFSRGYNQAQVVAHRLSRLSKVPLGRPIIRVRDTRTQTEIHSAKGRHDNMKGAFHLAMPGAVGGHRILVIDDVMTSGATLQAVGRVLQDGGAAALDAITLAVADPRGRGFSSI